MRPFVVTVADLAHRPAARRHEHLVAPLGEELTVTDTVVDRGSPIDVDVLLEAVSDGILATGTASTHWHASCRRCLEPAEGRVTSSFQELYSARPVDGETYELRHDQVDLELVAREAILLGLPLAPLCREECAGLCPSCGADLNDGPCSCAPTAREPRWAALDMLRAGLEHHDPEP